MSFHCKPYGRPTTNPRDRAYLLRILKPWFVAHHDKDEKAVRLRRLNAVLDAIGPILPGKVAYQGRQVPRRRAIALALIDIALIAKLAVSEPKTIGSFELARRFRKALANPKVNLWVLGVTDPDPPRATMSEQVRELLIDAIEQGGVDPAFDDADQQLDQDIDAIRQNQDRAAIKRLRRALTTAVAPKSPGGRPHEWPPDLRAIILDTWKRILGRKGGITVNADGMPGGPLITFTDACLRLVGLELRHSVMRTEAIYAWLRRR